MTDLSAGQQTAGSSTDLAQSSREFPGWLVLGWRGTGALTALALIGIGLYFRRYEGGAPNLFFVWSVTLMLMAGIVLVTRRILVASVLVAAMIAIVVTAAAVKHRVMEMSIHAYDLVYYMTSWSTLAFLYDQYRGPLLQLVFALLGLVLATVLAYRMDGTRIPRRYAAAAFATLIGATWVAQDWKGERRHTQQYWEDLVVSTFYSSWAETAETLMRGQLIRAAGAAPGPVFQIPASCEPGEKPPHIILVHQESVVPPEYFPQVAYDKAVDPMFRSGDGQLHKMRVETYGGASWLTEFSILAGVSTYSFGGMRPFVQSLMAGKVHDTLPEALSRCGYRNAVFYPLNRNFVQNAKFYTAVGMPEIYDMKDQGAPTGNERDRFYYANAMKLMEEHLKTSDKPLFEFVITMATHGPYLNPYMPEETVPGGGPGTHPEMHEYLRRLSMARIDFEAFRAELKRRFPGERILLVRYGDHQPIATRSYLGFGQARAAEDVALDKESPGFITYYAMEGLNYPLKPLPEHEVLDVPYFGTVLLEAAGLPLSDAQKERKRLMAVCGGRYDGCKPESEILAFHRRLIDSGLLQAR